MPDQTDLRDRIATAIWAQYPDAEPSRTGLVLATPHAVADVVLAVLRGLTLRELEQLARPNTPPSRPERRCPAQEPLDGAQCSKQAGHEVHSDRPGRIWYPVAGEAELSAGRALALCEAADALWNHPRASAIDSDFRAASDELRRMAAEAQQPWTVDGRLKPHAIPAATTPDVPSMTGGFDASIEIPDLPAAEAQQQPDTDDTDLTETDIDRMMAAGVPVQIVTAPPDTHGAGAQQQAAAETLVCVCGASAVQYGDRWGHEPGTGEACLYRPYARPRCPDCQMPHDLAPGSMGMRACASILASLAEEERRG